MFMWTLFISPKISAWIKRSWDFFDIAETAKRTCVYFESSLHGPTSNPPSYIRVLLANIGSIFHDRPVHFERVFVQCPSILSESLCSAVNTRSYIVQAQSFISVNTCLPLYHLSYFRALHLREDRDFYCQWTYYHVEEAVEMCLFIESFERIAKN